MPRQLALLIDLVLLVALWWAAALWLDRSFLPTPLAVLTTFASELQDDLLLHIAVSARRIIISVGLGVLAAGPLAIVSAQSRTLSRFVTPLIYVAYPAPKIVFLPLIIVFLGLGDPSIVFLITLIIFFQVFVIVHDAASQVQPQMLDSMAALGAGRWHLLRYVYLPLSLAAIVTALKVSIGTAIAVLFIAESIGNNVGLGYYIVVEQWGRFAYAGMYAGILAMSLLGLSFFVLLSGVESWLGRWKANGQRTHKT